MDAVYFGLLTFLVTGALIIVGFHIVVSLQQHRTATEQRTARGQSRGLNVAEIQIAMPDQAKSSVLQVRRWDIRQHQFRGFHSPPGRF